MATFIVCSCVSLYEVNPQATLKILVIDAMISDEDIEQKIRIRESVNTIDLNYYENTPLSNVEIIVNKEEVLKLTSEGDGYYALPKDFRAKVGDSYKLVFLKTDGTKYESNEQKMQKTPKIDKFYDEFLVDDLEKDNKKVPANYVYIDFNDPKDETNYYYWTWKLWERQVVCGTEYSVDYYCRQNCWEILYSNQLNIFSDIYTNGNPIERKVVAQIPFYQLSGALLEIKQYCVTAEAYRFLKLLSLQADRTGTLVDTPPAALIGNVKNISNPTEQVAGFFMVGGNITIKYWLNRQNADGKASPIGLLGRKSNPNNFGLTYPCVESPNRTPIKPRGWVD